MNTHPLQAAPAIVTGREDRFSHETGDTCIMYGVCASACPIKAIERGDR